MLSPGNKLTKNEIYNLRSISTFLNVAEVDIKELDAYT